MTKLTFSTTRSLNEGRVVEFIQQAKDALGLEKLTLTPVTDNPDISFGAGGRVELPLPSDVTYEQVYTALQSLTQRPIPLNGKVLFVDVETHGAEKLWKMPKREFFRLGQYGWGMHSPVVLTTDYDEIMDAVRDADVVVAHNGWSFDFHVLDMYDRHKGFDTMVFANLAFPAPEKFLTAEGKWKVTSGSPTAVKSWLSLDNLAHQLGFSGKLGDLKEMARKHNPPKTPTAELDFGLIPLDDPEFLHYAEQDIHALRDVAYGLFQKRTPGVYDFREQEAARIGALMTRNGFMLDIPAATKRRDELLERKNVLLEKLNREYGLPTEGKMPWRTTAGKKAILDILADSGITEESRPHWERTATGNLSLGGEALTALDPDSELVQSLAELMGQRPLAQQALDYVGSDGRTHSDVTMVQRSGRSSITKPGLTTWSNRKDKTDKSYFLASPGHVLISADYSNADQRAVAAMSQDEAYFERFVPGADGHEISGRLMFGDEVYDSDPHKYREISKACIAEGELVWTDSGLKPIESVDLWDKVWDGHEWVSHDGVIFKGWREVIEYDGLRATSDHIVLSGGLEIPFGQAASEHKKLDNPRNPWQDVRGGGSGAGRGKAARKERRTVRLGGVRRVWGSWLGKLGELVERKNSGTPALCARPEVSVSPLAEPENGLSVSTVREPKQPRFSGVRGSWGNFWVWERSRGLYVRLRELLTTGQVSDNRPNRHEQGVRAGEHPNGDTGRANSQPSKHGVEPVRAETLAVRVQRSGETASTGTHKGGYDRESQEHRGDQGFPLQPRSTKVRVYDILNTGRRNHFTVSGVLVHNCSHAYAYGAGVNTLAKTAKLPKHYAQMFVDAMERAYPKVISWQNSVRSFADRHGFVRNMWGRVMQVEAERSYTTSVALQGQSTTREVMIDGLIALVEAEPEFENWLVLWVHDEIICDVPLDKADHARVMLETHMPQHIHGIDFTISVGDPAPNWSECGH